MLGPNAWQILAGAGLVLAGFLLRRWTSRYDIEEALKGSLWSVVLGRRTVEKPTAIELMARRVDSQATLAGKARQAAGLVAGHGLSQVARVLAALLIIAGLLQIALGYFWR
jgi:hypothetical protein